MNNWKSSIHPVEILADELEEIDLTISQLAQKIYVSSETLYHILQGDANLTGDIALKLGRFFNTGAELWMNLQKAYELDVARENLGNRVEERVHLSFAKTLELKAETLILSYESTNVRCTP